MVSCDFMQSIQTETQQELTNSMARAFFSCSLTNKTQTATWTPHDNTHMMFMQHITATNIIQQQQDNA